MGLKSGWYFKSSLFSDLLKMAFSKSLFSYYRMERPVICWVNLQKLELLWHSSSLWEWYQWKYVSGKTQQLVNDNLAGWKTVETISLAHKDIVHMFAPPLNLLYFPRCQFPRCYGSTEAFQSIPRFVLKRPSAAQCHDWELPSEDVFRSGVNTVLVRFPRTALLNPSRQRKNSAWSSSRTSNSRHAGNFEHRQAQFTKKSSAQSRCQGFSLPSPGNKVALDNMISSQN